MNAPAQAGLRQHAPGDDDLSLIFTQPKFAAGWVREHGDRFRFLDERAQDLRWWQPDEGWVGGVRARAAVVPSMVEHITSQIRAFDDIDAPEEASKARKRAFKTWLDLTRIKKCIELAAKMQRMLALPEEWDRDPDLLGLPGGLVWDFGAGGARDQRAEDLVFRKTGTLPASDSDGLPALFGGLLDNLTESDPDRARALQLVAGSMLLGRPYRALPALVGPGGSGKSVFGAVVLKALGDYGCMLQGRTLTGKDQGAHLAEFSVIENRRGVIISELAGGRMVPERAKMLSGGDRVMVRGMREDPREADQTHTLLVLCNDQDLPVPDRVDSALADRLCLIPAGPKVKRRDRMLAAKIIDGELPFVLEWMLAGAAALIDDGGELVDLAGKSKAVRERTDQYVKDIDAVSGWIAECVVFVAQGFLSRKQALESSREFFERNGYPAARPAALYRHLADLRGERGHRLARESQKRIDGKMTRGYAGVRLRDSLLDGAGEADEADEAPIPG